MDELLYLSPRLNQGNTEHCTAYQAVACRANEKNLTSYDPESQWLLELMMGATEQGTDIQTALATGVDKGFIPTGDTVAQDNASCYLWVHPNNGMDWFDSIRRAIQDTGRPLSAGVMWMSSWDATPIIQNTGTSALGGHAIKIAGWKQINGQPYLVIQNSWGQNMGDIGLWYFPREIVNKVFGDYGVGYWSDDPNLKIKKMGLLLSMYINLLNWLNQLVKQNGTYPPKQTMIQKWAAAIQVEEGWNKTSRSYKNNNPGNLKSTTLTRSWGATGADAGNFCIYPNYKTGFNALCNFLTLGADDELKSFHQARTLIQFTKVYAEPPSDQYALNVASALGVLPDVDISTFL